MPPQNTTRFIILNYISYLALFVGTGFISGAIVHSGEVDQISKYIIIGLLGMALFIAGSFMQENLNNKENLRQGGAIKFFLYSLILSIGIGAISGGTQHFSDFPVYASILIPLGFVVSWFAFVLKNSFKFTKNILVIGGLIGILSIPLYFGLSVYAETLKVGECNKTSFNPFKISVFASVEHDEESKCQTKATKTEIKNTSINTSAQVTDDRSFIEYVIPHHQDAIDGSSKILATTQDPELKTFLNNVINTQGQEIVMLKGYYKTWFKRDYVDNGSYKPMMKVTKAGAEADKEYIQSMLGHHSKIIDVAKIVLNDSKTQYKSEILSLSKKIIKDQEADNALLNKWIVEKYKTPAKIESKNKIDHEDDGHADH